MPLVSLVEVVQTVQIHPCLISFPTDTVPALAAKPEHADLIYQAKQRSHEKPLILMGATAADLWPYVQGNAAERAIWDAVVAVHWPGALTLVLPSSDRLPSSMNPLDPTTIGIRVPNCAIAQDLLAQTGPLATTSVNRSGMPALQTLQAVSAEFPEVLVCQEHLAQESEQSVSAGIPSTVAKWTGQGWHILRQGTVTLEA
jgi:L-threonylcarbamoyladenylate synthase